MKQLQLNCTCRSINHTILLQKDEDEEVIIYVHLSDLPFWSRVKYAFKYLFLSVHSSYGSFDEIILDKEQQEKLVNFIKE
jgi:hypothetical protein